MQMTLKKGSRRAAALMAVSVMAFAVTSCAAPEKTAGKKTRSKEYFAESAYGVKASPRVSNLRSKLPRGGGRDQTGKPYKVKGRWFYPKEEKGYSKTGEASWYGDAFHGRLTANGEVYDMTHLTAAHPTMPLPSYARVTNTQNGSSVIVRVNDRGPFEKGRLIDLSHKAAEMLDYAHAGRATVKVDYLGRAPLHGKDDSFLMASYRPAGKAPGAEDGLPSGVMIAMNGPTPTQSAGATSMTGYPTNAAGALNALSSGASFLPETGPVAPDRPGSQQFASAALPVLGYAPAENIASRQAFTAFDGGADYIALGTYSSETEAGAHAAGFAELGKIGFESSEDGVAVTLTPNGHASIDDLLEAAWAGGAPDAFIVRN